MNTSDNRFNDLFDDWADTYDDTITTTDGEYKEVFQNYDKILSETTLHIAKFKGASVIEIGSGTGNLTYTCSLAGYNVTGFEPNSKMRSIAANKYPSLNFAYGTFLFLPIANHSIDSIISSYAFHHLTDDEKYNAVKLFKEKLKSDGNVIIADTMYETLETRDILINESYNNNYLSLAHDLETEFYTTHKVLSEAFESEDFRVDFVQTNKFVWILTARLK